MAVHAPAPPIRVPADPVFRIALLSPPQQEHCMRLWDPAKALLNHGLATWGNSMWIFFTELLYSLFRDYSGLVVRKCVICKKLDRDRTVSEDVLHHLYLGYFAKPVANKLSFEDFSFGLAFFVLCALVIGLLIRCTLFRHHVCMFHKKSVEMRPASVAALYQKVTTEYLLDRKWLYVSTILELEPRIDCLNKSKGITSPTISLL